MINKMRAYYLGAGIMAVVALMVVIPDVAYAGPGGFIAKEVASTWLGKMALTIMGIVLLPLIIYVLLKQRIAISKTKSDLAQLAKVNYQFRWTFINERAHMVIRQVYTAWKQADTEKAALWMTDWYWQNQKMTVLDEWESEGLKNYCSLNKITNIRPLYIEYSENEPGDGEGSRIKLLVDVNIQDYLMIEKTNEIVQGDTKFKDFESIWTLLLENGCWKLALIEESRLSLAYAKMTNDLEEARGHIHRGFKYNRSIGN